MVTNVEERLASKRPLLVRLRERFRYGLLWYELLEQVHRRTGFCVYPYAIFTNGSDELSEQPLPIELGSRLKIRKLDACDTELIGKVAAHQKQTPDELQSRLRRKSCMVALVDEAFAGFYWVNKSACDHPIIGREPLFTLERNEACIAFNYVVPEYRGYRIAGALSRAMCKALEAEGRDRRYWTISSLNASPHRHVGHARGNVRLLERRILVGVPKYFALDIRTGLKRAGAKTQFVRVCRIRAKPLR